MKDLREQYPNDVDLVNELSGQDFSRDTKFKVTLGPMSINIYCNSFNAGRLFASSSTPQKIKWAAFASSSGHNLPILYNVFNTSTLQQKLTGSRVLEHENQHQENKLFRKQFDQSQNESLNLWHQYKNEQDTETKRALLESYLKVKRDEALVQAKDEVLAMKKGGEPYKYDIWFKQDNSPYDYLSYLRDYEDTDLWKECSQKLLVEEYRKIIENAVSAFDQLTKKGLYSTDQAIALLSDKPLTDWPKTVRRLLEFRQRRESRAS